MRRIPGLLMLGLLVLLVGCPSEEDGVGVVGPKPKTATPSPTPKPAASGAVTGGISDKGQLTPPPSGIAETPAPTPTPTLRPLDEPGGNPTPPAPTPTFSVDPYEGSLPP